MLELNSLAEFSRAHCVSICAFLVPINLIGTLATILFAALHRPSYQVQQIAAIASISPLVMVFHVYTWFTIGVVMIPTYILLWLAITCLLTNVGTVWFSRRYTKLQLRIRFR